MKRIYFLSTIILLFSCDPKDESIDFLEPQPNNIDNSKSFNKHYRGYYKNANNNSTLLILNDKIIKSTKIQMVSSRNDIDSSFKGDKYDNKQIESALEKENITVDRFVGDSIYSTWTFKDTIFRISDQNLCRFYKGSYFLNYTYDQMRWKVQRLDLDKNKLTMSMIMPNDSLFEELPVRDKCIIKYDSAVIKSYQIKPSKQELKRLVKNNSFKEWDVWIKEK
jgi:hypothetical protein